jgi:hypothetical protein
MKYVRGPWLCSTMPFHLARRSKRCKSNLSPEPGAAARLYRNRIFFAADEQSTGGGFVSNANDILNSLYVFKFTSRVLICSYVY